MVKFCSGCLILCTLVISSIYALTGKIIDKHNKNPVKDALIYWQSNPFLYDITDSEGNFEIESGLTYHKNPLYFQKNKISSVQPASIFLLNGRKAGNNDNVRAAHGLFITQSQENRRALFLNNKFKFGQTAVLHAPSTPVKFASLEINDTLIISAAGYSSQKFTMQSLSDGVHLELDTSSPGSQFKISDMTVSYAMYSIKHCRDTLYLSAYVLPSMGIDTVPCIVHVSTPDPFTKIVKNQSKTYSAYNLKTIEFSVLVDRGIPPAHRIRFDFQYETTDRSLQDSYYFLVNPFSLEDFSIVTEIPPDSTIKPDGVLNINDHFEIKLHVKNETGFPAESLNVKVIDPLIISDNVTFPSFLPGESRTTDSTLLLIPAKEYPDSIFILNILAYGTINGKRGVWIIPHEMKVRLDLSPPVINFTPDKHIKVETFQGFTDPGFSAIDAYDGDCTARVTTRTDTFPKVLLIKYTATDLANHTIQRERTVAAGTVPIFEKYIPGVLPPLNDISCKLTSVTVEGEGPALSSILSISINYSSKLKTLYDFSFSCSSAPYYSAIISESEFYLNESFPEVIIRNSKIQGLDGSYYIYTESNSTGNTITLISKSGLFAVTFKP